MRGGHVVDDNGGHGGFSGGDDYFSFSQLYPVLCYT